MAFDFFCINVSSSRDHAYGLGLRANELKSDPAADLFSFMKMSGEQAQLGSVPDMFALGTARNSFMTPTWASLSRGKLGYKLSNIDINFINFIYCKIVDHANGQQVNPFPAYNDPAI